MASASGSSAVDTPEKMPEATLLGEHSWRAGDGAIASLLAARHGDPFALLGPHASAAGVAIRAFVPGASLLAARLASGESVALARRDEAGFFEGLVPGASLPLDYVLHAENDGGSWEIQDPYRFPPVLGGVDDYLLGEGTHRALYRRLGAHTIVHDGVWGVHFAVWAPNAQRVSVVGSFNAWDGRVHAMRKRLGSGVWEIFLPGLGNGAVYKYEILDAHGQMLPLKADPFGRAAELRPSTASVVASDQEFPWSDADHLARRATVDQRRSPMSIYEVHLGSWQRHDDGSFLSYDELAERLVPYAQWMGFTHLQFLPVSEHPLDASWGYQPIGLFAPTARFGEPEAFARLVDRAHAAGLGVLLDWVPAHFPTDSHGLARFDGTALYEHLDPRKGFHPDWNTAIYNFGRREVANTLYASALYWLDAFHIDGLRADAVASMLYLDYSRRHGEWVPNEEGGNTNLEAVEFLRHANSLAYGLHPGITMVAEESTAWPGVSAPADAGGLGFGFKWNMGWMNDTLAYISHDPVHRRWHHDELTFGLLYGFSENFILPISHDEVVHGKGSLLNRIPGDDWQKFATLRAYYAFMWAHPGKKLLFMGQEFGQRGEWNFDRALEWISLDGHLHRGLRDCVRDLNHLYRDNPALHARDCEAEGFRWLVVDDADQSVIAWLRLGAPGDAPVAMVANFTPVPRAFYRVGLPEAGRWTEILNTDAALYGGSGTGNLGAVQATLAPAHNQPASAELYLPPLATIYLRLERR
jgi:1,4-alpha-glucan branching enzyme